MKLTLDTRDVGRVTVVRCGGRLVSGPEVEALRAQIAHILRDRRSIILHLGDLVFIDSSGLGTLVRTLTTTRQSRGDLKLCNVPDHVKKVLNLSHLTKLFDCHESEENAIAAFYSGPKQVEQPASAGKSVLCVDTNTDVVIYVRELLHRAGYDVHTSSNLRDGLLLMRVSRFDLVLLGPGASAAPATEKNFRDFCAKTPLVELGSHFSTLEAGEAAAELLRKVAEHLQPATA